MTGHEALFTAQKRVAVFILNFVGNTTKKKAADKLTLSDVEARQALLQEYWKGFQDRDLILAEHMDSLSDRSYFKADLYGSTMEAYLYAKAWLEEKSKELQGPSDTHVLATHDRSIAENSVQRTFERLKLPRFDGTQRDWEAFKKRFTSLVIADKGMTPVIKLEHLLNCLSGETQARLKGIQMVGANFLTAWETLCRRYDNRFLRFSTQMQAVTGTEASDEETGTHINQLLNTTNESINVFRTLGLPVEHWDAVLIYFIESKLATPTRLDWARELEKKKNNEFPTFAEFKYFLEDRIRTLDLVVGDRSKSVREETSAPEESKKTKKSSAHVATPRNSSTREPDKCSFCDGPHFIGRCSVFSNAPPTNRRAHVQTARLCLNCLSARHVVGACTSKYRCSVCHEKHHTKLHQDKTATSNAAVATLQNAESESAPGEASVRAITGGQTVLLATACVVLQSPGAAITVRALLDSGAEESFVTEQAVQALGLRRQSTHVAVNGVGAERTAVARSRVHLTLKSERDDKFSLDFTALVLKRLTSLLPRLPVDPTAWPHLASRPLADPVYFKPGRIDCILNAEALAKVIRPGIDRQPGAPTAMETSLGWVVLGKVPVQETGGKAEVSGFHVAVDRELTSALTRFWEIEEVNKPPQLSPQDEECYDHFRRTHSRRADGRFVVRLPFAREPVFADSKSTAAACLTRLERRFVRQPELAPPYKVFMQEYQALGHMEKVVNEQSGKSDVFYLPHHAVFKDGGKGKIRVVFNASQADSAGVSLNSCLHAGPKLQEDVLVIIIRWCFRKYVFTCDVVKMFRQFLVQPDDADWQRILWRFNEDEVVTPFRLVTVTYGTTCAPFLANACMLQLADDEQKRFPRGAQILRKGRYADDSYGGGDTLEEARLVRDELVSILRTAGMEVGKWAANHAELLQELGLESPAVAEREFRVEEAVSTLGLRWMPQRDAFCFKIALVEPPQTVTKRSILSEVSKLFDPIGWLAPVLVRAKLLLQTLWRQGVDWDVAVSATLSQSWSTFKGQLVELEELRIPRWFGTVGTTKWDLHGFCDASESAYAASLYLVAADTKVSRLIVAKSKVAPIKVISLPKLELCGAQLLVRLVNSLLSKLDSQPVDIHCWSYSKVALAWLQGHPSRWKPFVANRVSEILTSLPHATWRHVRSADNPADCATRGFTPTQLRESILWWNGPSWITLEKSEWPGPLAELKTDLEARSMAALEVCVARGEESWSEWCARSSSLHKLIRVFAYMVRWRSNAKLSPLDRRKTWLSAQELARGRTILLRVVQNEEFADEFRTIRTKGSVSARSSIRRLLPFTDAEGVLRVGGRLDNSFLTESEKHPIILPGRHHVTRLIIADAHRSTLHGGPVLVQSQLSRRYWVVRGRNEIRGVVRKCVTCARFNARLAEQQMAPLPAVRTVPARPFTFTGLDYAGPFLLKTSGGRGQRCSKGYVAIFICMVVKAVHIEVVSDLTTAAFLAAFARFVARRGLCHTVYSDNGTTFQGAAAELRRLFEATSAMTQEIAAAIAADGIQWSHIPPRAPHFGGLWEANVRSFKRHLKRVIGDAKLTYEEFSTVCHQIEACLNSRPLGPLSSNEEDVSALTPGHFLIGSALKAPVEPFTETNEKVSVCSRWRLLSLMRNHFWKRWRREFLTQLQQRSKWLRPGYDYQVGDLVILMDDPLPPTKWPLARVVRQHRGTDGVCRVVTLRTATTQLRRPVHRLIHLPINETVAVHFMESRVPQTTV
ncbi:uncharacterized protein LOC143211619 [Lasioglossum baleicum]|uniref:uncharacterized protein LOC143211619 n=1 Tax=Lasioglossum baleicum TaxID=434251 RepID=UPI003FCD0402